MAKLITIPGNTKTKPKSPINPGWRKLFLAALAETSNVTAAAAAAGIEPTKAYRERRRDSAFRGLWMISLMEGYLHLELETLYRLRFGTSPGDQKFDIGAALRLLMLHRETVAQQRALSGPGDKDSVLASLNAKIEAMRSREAETKQILINDGRFGDLLRETD